MKLIDLTHTLKADVPTWEGGCGFSHHIESDYAPSTEEVSFRVHKLAMAAGIGTHLDAPAHGSPQGKDLSQLALQDLYAPCVVIDVSPKATVDYLLTVADIQEHEKTYGVIEKGAFVIVYTGWDRFWSNAKSYRNNHLFPSVSEQAAQALLDRDISGIGIDTLSPDRGDSLFPVHRLVLGQGKYIVENVAYAQTLPATGAYTLALPLKIEGGTESPIRLIAIVP